MQLHKKQTALETAWGPLVIIDAAFITIYLVSWQACV